MHPDRDAATPNGGAPDEASQTVFNRMDLNSDGVVDAQEFDTAVSDGLVALPDTMETALTAQAAAVMVKAAMATATTKKADGESEAPAAVPVNTELIDGSWEFEPDSSTGTVADWGDTTVLAENMGHFFLDTVEIGAYAFDLHTAPTEAFEGTAMGGANPNDVRSVQGQLIDDGLRLHLWIGEDHGYFRQIGTSGEYNELAAVVSSPSPTPEIETITDAPTIPTTNDDAIDTVVEEPLNNSSPEKDCTPLECKTPEQVLIVEEKPTSPLQTAREVLAEVTRLKQAAQERRRLRGLGIHTPTERKVHECNDTCTNSH